MKILFYALILVLCSSAANAAGTFEFKGVPLGVTEQELLKVHSKYTCTNADKLVGDRVCHSDDTYAGVKANVMLMFYADRLESIYISFSSEDFEDVNAALTTKYGKPSKSNTAILKNAMGARFQNKTNEWKRKDGSIVITKIAGKITDSELVIQSATYPVQFEKRERERTKTRNGDM